MTLSSGNFGMPEEPFDPIGSVLETQIEFLDSIVNTWQFQVLNNVDCIAEEFKGLLTPADHSKLLTLLETTVKRPIRRQGGRIRGVSGSLKALFHELKQRRAKAHGT